ncbi:MAG: toll/interleukin-1 receptor domain-containing protein [Chloroflexaceae bacterium]
MITPTNPPTPSPRSLRVFLCYAPPDLARVRELYRQLRAAGVQPWFDEEDLRRNHEKQRKPVSW